MLRTRLCYLVHGHAFLLSHKAEHAEDDEAGVEARAAVDEGYQQGVSVNSIVTESGSAVWFSHILHNCIVVLISSTTYRGLPRLRQGRQRRFYACGYSIISYIAPAYVPQAVVVKFIEAGHSNQASCTGAERIEYLRCRVRPYLTIVTSTPTYYNNKYVHVSLMRK